MVIHERPSPNHGPRATNIDMLVLHYTGMSDAAAALARLCAPEAAVSAHYVIDEDGAIFRLVAEDRRAWHAGVASWRGRSDVNGASIGVELVNPGHEFGYRRFPEPQMTALETLAADLVRRRAIPKRNVVGHSDVAPSRKQDPGELFDWRRLARAGIGLWPEGPRQPGPDGVAATQRLLAAIGYAILETGDVDAATRAVVSAFQRHFRQACCDGALDDETRGLIAAVAALCDEI